MEIRDERKVPLSQVPNSSLFEWDGRVWLKGYGVLTEGRVDTTGGTPTTLGMLVASGSGGATISFEDPKTVIVVPRQGFLTYT